MSKVAGGLVLLVVGAAQALKPSGYFWLRYTYENLTVEAKEHPNYFSVERGYFRLKQDVSEELTVKATIDVAMRAGATQRTDWLIRLKDAAAEWKPPLLPPEAKFILGLQRTHFGYIDLWKYPLIEKSLENKEKLISSRELGVGFTADLPGGYGDLALGLFNGTGYTRPVETNENKAFLATLSLTPLPWLMLRGSSWMAKQPLRIEGGEVDVNQDRIAGVVQVKMLPLLLVGQYLTSTDGEVDGAGFMGFLQLFLGPKISLAGRFDQWDPNTASKNDSHQRLIAGINYELTKNLLCQINYDRKHYEDPEKGPEDMARVQFRYDY